MPAERFTDEYLAKFHVEHRTPVPEKARWSDNQSEHVLTPNRYTQRPESLGVSRAEWDVVARLAKAGGHFGLEESGMAPGAVKCLAKALRTAVAGGTVKDPATFAFLDRLLPFLDGPGALGFSVQKGWRRMGR